MKYKTYFKQLMSVVDTYLLPSIQSFFQYLYIGLESIIELLKTPDHSYKAELLPSSSLLSRFNKGFCLNGKQMLPLDLSYRNALVCAPTGMGKTSVIALPTCIKSTSSLIINDPSGELFLKSSAYNLSKGAKIFTLNFADASVSDGFNPLLHIHNASDASKIASMLVRSVLKNSGDPFWSIQATSLITTIIQVVKHQPKEFQTFANVRYLVQQLGINPSIVDSYVAKTNNPTLIADYKSFISFEIKVRKSIESTALASLSIFGDPQIAKVTSVDTIPFSSFRKSQCILYLHSKTSDMQYYATLLSIVFELLCKEIMHTLPNKSDVPIFFILDEASSLYLPSLQIVLANIRKFNAGIMLIVQDFQQLIGIYGKAEAEAMRSNTFAKIYFGGCTENTAKELSSMLGKYEWEDERGSKKIREVLTPDEVRMLPSNKAIMIAANYKPVLMRMFPYFENPFLRLKTNLPAVHLQSSILNTPIPFL